MAVSITDQPFIQILYNLTILRVYYCRDIEIDSFFLSEVNLDQIIPLVSPKVYVIKNKLMELIGGNKNIDFRFFYPSNIKSKYKKQVITNGAEYEINENTERLITKSLLTLMLM
jgi:hypothetical protein